MAEGIVIALMVTSLIHRAKEGVWKVIKRVHVQGMFMTSLSSLALTRNCWWP